MMLLAAVAALALLVPVVLATRSYNLLVAQATSIDAMWSGIDVELQRRHDLVPALVATASAYATHERETLEALVAARARAREADAEPSPGRTAAEDQLTDGITGLLAVAEAHPEMRADAHFRELQQLLVEVEDRIVASRRLYNVTVASYERRRRAFPSNAVAGTFGFEARRMFELHDPAAAHRPLVSI